MNEFKIVHAQLNPKTEVSRIGYAKVGNARFFAAHQLLIELAYEKVGEFSGIPKSALIPPTIITDTDSLQDKGWRPEILYAIRHGLRENAELVADSLPLEYKKGLNADAAISEMFKSLDMILAGMPWDNYLANGPLPAVVVMGKTGRRKNHEEDARHIVGQMVNGHLAALSALVDTEFRNPPGSVGQAIREREIEIRTIISTIMRASGAMGELEAVLAGKGDARKYDTGYLEGLRMEWLRTMVDFMYGNCGGNLALLLNFVSDMARYELGTVLEFSTRRHLDALRGTIAKARPLGELLAERGMLEDGAITEQASEEISANVHGFFMQGLVRE